MNSSLLTAIALLASLGLAATAQEATIRIDTHAPGKPVSPWLTGACIEDVNHEIYGGIYSQMIFGESFQEPPTASPVGHFTAAGGEWEVRDGELRGGAGPGPKLVSDIVEPFITGEVGVELYLPGNQAGNGGLILRVNRPAPGADDFDGYEVAIHADRKVVMLGRHQHNFALLKEVPCDVAPDRWINLSVKVGERSIDVSVDGKSVLQFEDPHPLKAGVVGLRQWQRPARYRHLWVKTKGQRTDLPFVAATPTPVVSGMWSPVTTAGATLAAAIERERPFIGTQSQRVAQTGEGEAGIANKGLNHQGMAFVGGQTYEGYLWLRAEHAVDLFASLENQDGSHRLAEQRINVQPGDWRRYDFQLTPRDSVTGGQFALRLKSAGASVVVGHAFLQPGAWGRFKGLPLRRDVVEGLIDQGVTVLRYGGSMVNAPEYRWKKMIGPRDRRPPYKGNWYPYSTNGWGIPDFLNLCEAAGFLGIPDFNIDESPQDMADFIEYANGPADSTWGKVRAAHGHPQPYRLKHIELGNEERVDETYYAKFAALAKAIWARDPDIILVVGDFAYHRPIVDPMNIQAADSRITSLAGQQKILQLAKANNREVWFDVHIDTDKAEASPSLKALPTLIDALDKLADGARHKVLVFELNANNPRQRRALGNAVAIGHATRDGRLPVVTSANCLQVDGQNDNGWNQGLLFLNPSKVWLQPPGYVTQMISRTYQPVVLPVQSAGAEGLDVTAVRSEDGKTLVLRVANISAEPRATKLQLQGFTATRPAAEITELAAPPDAMNTASDPTHVRPTPRQWTHDLKRGGVAEYTFPPHSFTVMVFRQVGK
jgi:hypothetical protein